jgi:CTP-dependent riboflavin kinase
MPRMRKISGRIVSGAGKAAFFTQLDWVREQSLDKLGFIPYPGTLNLEVSEEDISALEALQKSYKGVCLIPPDPQFCEARVWPVCVSKVSGALIIPAEDVRIHGRHVIEILCPVRIKDVLSVDDGDLLTVEFDETGVCPHVPSSSGSC